MLGPALLTGPALGIVGGLVLVVITLATGDGSGGGFLMVVLVMGMAFGLIIATPAALIAGTPMVRLAAGDPRWARPKAWAAAGTAVGAIVGALFGLSIYEDVAAFVITIAFAAALGLLGALLCHRMVGSKIAAMNAIDTDIFA
ncbi:hypothetical protein [Pelagerythrobacter marensis]|uniref:Uncharacterized protein n=1 Tax=Pelagerythrobacter marensis TaxID=543877 RepID=A0A0G3XC43_9SPHN|nr:hypothetical protein [Pelagerythrobacter marensis]AKM08752.1 hypothetical protein AM2010_2697 [Pelagerythrobacter marensis]